MSARAAASGGTDEGAERGGFYEALGGIDGLRRLTESFYVVVRADPLLAPVFAHFTPTHVEHVAVWMSEVFGGPAGYTAELGGHPGLIRNHLGLSITEEQRARWAELMIATATKELPDDELLQQRFAEYIEWGTRIARSVSQPGVEPGNPGPVPQWGWDGLKKA
ncbi:group II truncated hemoglobin [Streptomyces fildesensis]|uniref:Group II truncated hemoglobin n=1 Tax=Streptomyces fildesensis TaxID=375757 RepID=A0ABW8CHD8_9ACTN